ncbi:MAG: hypothetical protein ACHQ50_12095 [Fimbriimonadales bacterium]
MRTFLSFAVLALFSASFSQEAKVTYTTPAVSAKKAVAGLAEKSGMKIACSTAMDKEILILRLQDAPVDQVMAQIAAVTSGTWSKEGETSYLVPNSSMRSGEEIKLRQRLAAKIADALKKQADAFAKAAKTTPAQQPAVPAMFAGIGAGNEAMTKLALAIGANQLASVDEGGRVVFSSNPTRMQRSLPGGANAIIDEFVADYNKRAALAKQDEPAKNEVDPNMAAFMELFGNRMKKPQPITTAPAKALVVASRRGMFMGYTLELKLYDAQGKMLANSSLPLVTDMPFDPQSILKPAAPPKNEGQEIQLSALAKELYSANRSFGSLGSGGAGNLKLSKELMVALRDPVEHDPLSFVHSEALIATAQQRNEQLVADLPDGVTSVFDDLVAKGKLTPESFLSDIKGEDKAQIQEGNGWIVISAANPVKARKERTDRVALRSLIQVAQAQGYLGLDTLASYAVSNEAPLEGAPASMMYVMLFAPGAMQQGMMGMVNWEMLRLYGMLDSGQRQALRQGTRLQFGQLAPGQQTQVSKMLFGADEVLTVETQQPGRPKQDPLTELITSQIERYTGGNESDYRSEPTEVMAGGLPANGYIVVNFSTEPVAQAQTMSSDFGRAAALGPMELGMLKFFKEDPSVSQLSGQIPTLDDLKVGSRSVYNFSFYVAPLVSEKQQLNDDIIPKDAPVYKIANLPADFQKRIDSMAASFKGNPIWKMVGQMGVLGQRAVPPE